jgi:GTPase SAR1 family protein
MEYTKIKKKELEMYTENKLKSPLFKIVLVGDSNVGKTSIIQTFMVIIYIY